MSVCPTIYPSVPLFVIRRLSISLIIHISILLFLNSSFHVSVYLSDCRSFSLLIILTVCLSVCLSLCSLLIIQTVCPQSVCLSVSLLIIQTVCLSVRQFCLSVWCNSVAAAWSCCLALCVQSPWNRERRRKRHSSETFIKPDPEDLKRTHITLQLSFFAGLWNDSLL